jgi:hypothetical protein
MAFENQKRSEGVWGIFARHFKEASAEFEETAKKNNSFQLDYVGLGMASYALATATRLTYRDLKDPSGP